MKIKYLLSMLLIVSIALTAHAQLKIGHVNLDLVLAYMPETQAMNQSLQTFQTKLAEQLKVKEDYARIKLQEYYEIKEQNPPPNEATTQAKEAELMKIDEDIRKEAAESEQKLLGKRQELMEPITQKLEENLKYFREVEGYDYILNSVDGNGVSIVLQGPEEHNLTEKLMKRLGIEIPSND